MIDCVFEIVAARRIGFLTYLVYYSMRIKIFPVFSLWKFLRGRFPWGAAGIFKVSQFLAFENYFYEVFHEKLFVVALWLQIVSFFFKDNIISPHDLLLMWYSRGSGVFLKGKNVVLWKGTLHILYPYRVPWLCHWCSYRLCCSFSQISWVYMFVSIHGYHRGYHCSVLIGGMVQRLYI